MTRTAAILGAGTLGAGWAARFALMGWDVRVFDPDAAAIPRVADTLARARAALPAVYDVALPSEGQVSQVATISAAVADVDWIHESIPERLDLKRKLFQTVQAHAGPEVILASSSATFSASELQGCATRPGQILRVSPVDPVYLFPTLALEGADSTEPERLDRAAGLLADIGMAAGDTDAATALARLAMNGAPDVAARDASLVTLLRGLRARAAPLTARILAHEATLAPAAPNPDAPVVPVTLDRQVPVTWVDYNGHMNEARYVTAFSAAADRLLLWAGMDAAAIAAGQSVFTVETHVRYLAEVQIGDRIRVTTRVLQGGGRKFHIWHELFVGDRLSATGEQLLLHVDLSTRRSSPPPPGMADWLERAAAAHAALPTPKGLGRHVGQRS